MKESSFKNSNEELRETEGRSKLRRCLGLGATTGLCVGIILGAGIYSLMGIAVGLCGPMMWLPFLISAVYCVFEGLTYAELATMYPKAGASFVYIKRGLSTLSPKLSEFISFTLTWSILVGSPMVNATIALAFAAYFTSLINAPVVPVAIGCVIVVTILNWIGIRETSLTAGTMTLIEAGGLVLIILLGSLFGKTSPNYLATPPMGMIGIIHATALGFFIYEGYELMGSVAEEIENPGKTIPRAVVLAIAIVTLLYLGVSLTITRLAPWESIAGSASPMVDATKTVLAAAPSVFSFIGIFATFNTVLGTMTSHSRLIYGMASEGVFPRALTRIDPKRRTPWISVLLIGALACVACLIGEIEIVAYAGIIGSTFGTVVICICLILLRLREPELERPFRVPGSVRNIPIMTVLCAVISAIVIAMLPLVSWIPTLAIWLIGAIAYLLLRRRK